MSYFNDGPDLLGYLVLISVVLLVIGYQKLRAWYLRRMK